MLYPPAAADVLRSLDPSEKLQGNLWMEDLYGAWLVKSDQATAGLILEGINAL